MQHATTLEVTSRAIRAKICTRCYQRPNGSEGWDGSVPRSCEAQCAIFRSLPKLIGTAIHLRETDDFEAKVREKVCEHCHLSPTAGDFCAEFATRACPLSRHVEEIAELVSKVLSHPHLASRT